MHEPEASEITRGPKERCGSFERRVAHLRDMGAVSSMGAAVRDALGCGSLCQFNDC
jgi:hypothetical protein